MSTVNSSSDRQKLLNQAMEQLDRKLAQKLIIEEGVDPAGVKDQLLVVFLKVAVESRDAPLVNKLLEKKPNLNTLEGSQILQIVMDDGDTEIASMLIRAGVRLEPSYVSHMVRCRNEKKAELALMMLDHGVELHECEGVLREAILHKSLDFTEELLRRGALYRDAVAKSNMNERVWEAFVQAVSIEKIKAIELLMKYGFDITENHSGIYPVYIAAGTTKSAVIEYLIKKGANIHQANSDLYGRYPIHIACEKSSYENVKLLLSLGVDFNVFDNFERTPFSLLNKGPYINETQRMCIKRFVLQLAKLDLKNIAYCKMYYKYKLWERSEEQQKFLQECTLEVTIWKELKVLDKYSVFDILNMNIKQLSFLVRSSNFVDSFRGVAQNEGLVLFAEDIDENLEDAIDRKNSFTVKEEALREAIFEFVPDLVIEKIVHYMYLHDV